MCQIICTVYVIVFSCIVKYRFTDTNAKIINMLPCSLPLFHKKKNNNLMLCHKYVMFFATLPQPFFHVIFNFTSPQTFSCATKLGHSLFSNIALTPHQSYFIPVSLQTSPKPTSPKFTIFQAPSQMSHSSYNEQKFSLYPFPVSCKNVSIF